MLKFGKMMYLQKDWLQETDLSLSDKWRNNINQKDNFLFEKEDRWEIGSAIGILVDSTGDSVKIICNFDTEKWSSVAPNGRRVWERVDGDNSDSILDKILDGGRGFHQHKDISLK